MLAGWAVATPVARNREANIANPAPAIAFIQCLMIRVRRCRFGIAWRGYRAKVTLLKVLKNNGGAGNAPTPLISASLHGCGNRAG
jgi:hypothetical protein